MFQNDQFSQVPEHAQRRVHFSAAFRHLHLPLHPFLQPQRMSLRQDSEASGRLVHKGCHPASSFCHPQSIGLGRHGSGHNGHNALFQQFA